MLLVGKVWQGRQSGFILSEPPIQVLTSTQKGPELGNWPNHYFVRCILQKKGV
jgi:hypothetical protein